MYRIIYGGFAQETNTFSPKICTRENFAASSIRFGEEIKVLTPGHDSAAGMLQVLTKAEDVELIYGAHFSAGSYGRVEQSVADEFITYMVDLIEKSKPFDGLFLRLHGGMCLTEEDDGIGYILKALRKATGNKVVIAASTDLHANITRLVMENVDILTGFHEYPHTDHFETGERAAVLGLQMLRIGRRIPCAWVKIPMILQAEACTTKSGPLKELIDYGDDLQKKGELIDFSIYHMQPWLDCLEAGASAVVYADTQEKAEKYASDLANRFFSLRHVLQYHPISVDEGLDLAVKRPTGEMIVLSDAADNTSGGATGDSVVVLRRILERKLDIKAACVVVDPEAVDQAIALGVGAEAEFTIGGKLDPARQKSVTFTGKVISIPNPVVQEVNGTATGRRISFGKVAIVRVRNTDVVLCVYPQLNFTPTQFTGFGLKPEDYDMFLVKSSLAYKNNCAVLTSQLYNVDTPGSTTSNLLSLDFVRIPRPMYPFDDTDDFGPTPARPGRQA